MLTDAIQVKKKLETIKVCNTLTPSISPFLSLAPIWVLRVTNVYNGEERGGGYVNLYFLIHLIFMWLSFPLYTGSASERRKGVIGNEETQRQDSEREPRVGETT